MRYVGALLVAAYSLMGFGTAAADGVPQRIVIIGVPGLEWSDLAAQDTPNLWRLVTEAGSASMSVRAIPGPDGETCPIPGWLTLSAGQRAGASGTHCGLPPLPKPLGEGAIVPGFGHFRTYNAGTTYEADVGLLGRAVHEAGGRTAAIGPGGALAAADPTGRVDRYVAAPEQLPDLTPYALSVVDVDSLAKAWVDLGVDTAGRQRPLPQLQRREAVRAADRTIGAVLTRVTAGTTLVVAGVSDVTTESHLHVAMAKGGPFRHGYLTSGSTRQDALVTMTDLTSTALAAVGARQPQTAVGRPFDNDGATPAGPASTVRELADADRASQVMRQVRQPFFFTFMGLQLLIYLLAAVAVRRRWGGYGVRKRVLSATLAVGVVSGAMPVATFLAQIVPWWSSGTPMAALILAILVADLGVAAVALAGPWRRTVTGPLTVVSVISALVLSLEVITGSYLQVNAVTGYEPVTGGRYYGFSNIAWAVWATAIILAVAGLAQPLLDRGRRGLAVVAASIIGLLAVVLNGWPAWGADFGGVIALVPGIAVCVLMLAGRGVSLGRVGLLCAVGLGVILALSWLESLRPEADRTHLGRFFGQLVEGEAGAVMARKALAMLRTFGTIELSLLAVAATAFLYLVLMRPSRWGAAALGHAYTLAPALRAGLFGALTCALVGMLVNDSGVAIPAMALSVAVPLALAASVRAMLISGGPGEPPTTPAPPAGRSGSPAPPETAPR